MKHLVAIYILIALCTCRPAQAQLSAEVQWVVRHQPERSLRIPYQFDFSGSNEAQNLAHFSFTFYKKYISSQDAISCTFEPSCSVYGLHALRHHGLLIGSMATFDRLSRCHGWNRSYYPAEAVTGLNHDPVVHESH
ncbi:MAG: hypothetical protein C0424_06995 [Sphingobacteriaceae bacterium]|nr:hypothetical protein [Sphingobacteriaceae bacterium]